MAGPQPPDDATSTRAIGAKARAIDDRGVADRETERKGIESDQRSARPTSDATSVAGKTADDYVDTFLEVQYDPNDPQRSVRNNLSTLIHVHYRDGSKITLNIDAIRDDEYVELKPGEEPFYTGAAGRIFPRALSRAMTPNLWAAKRQVLVIMDEFNLLIMSMSFVVISTFFFPPPSAGLPWRFSLRTRGTSTPSGSNEQIVQRVRSAIERVKTRIGRPAIEEPPSQGNLAEQAPVKKPAGVNPVEAPFALLPGGEKVPPDGRVKVFYGTDEMSPDRVISTDGLPERGQNRSLLNHKSGGTDTAFRSVTDFLLAPGSNEQGAARWAINTADKGWVYQIEDVPVWALDKHLQGRVNRPAADPMRPFQDSPPGMRAEADSVIDARVPLKNITRVYEVTVVDGKIKVTELKDWSHLSPPPPSNP